MKKTPKRESRVGQGVSWEPEVLRKGKQRAKARRQSFSAYINELVFRDSVANFEHKEAQVAKPSEAKTAA